MSPWEPVSLSADIEDVIDLSMAQFTKEGNDMPDIKVKATDIDGLDELLANAVKAALAERETPEVEDDSDEDDILAELGITEAELDELAAEVLDDEADERELVDASNDDNEALELANARISDQEIELARMRNELDEKSYADERTKLAEVSGIPPRIVDLAKPLLCGSGRTVELSNGKSVDAGAIVRTVFAELGKTIKALDLSAERGSGIDLAADEDAKAKAEQRNAMAKSIREQFSL